MLHLVSRFPRHLPAVQSSYRVSTSVGFQAASRRPTDRKTPLPPSRIGHSVHKLGSNDPPQVNRPSALTTRQARGSSPISTGHAIRCLHLPAYPQGVLSYQQPIDFSFSFALGCAI